MVSIHIYEGQRLRDLTGPLPPSPPPPNLHDLPTANQAQVRDHCRYTQNLVTDFREEIWFILNNILEVIDALLHPRSQ